ncbi:hypothetical protein MCOR05_010812 [Pyricularia oryzae]|nr:hypothetical protein MCOR05_010812 [Pyricularia oryzae]
MWDFEIDPDGDITLILRNPNAILTVEPADAIEPPAAVSEPTTKKDKKKTKKLKRQPNLVPNEAPTPEVLFEPPLAVEPEPTLRVQAEDDSPEAEELPGPASPPKTVTEEYIPTPQKEVRFRVSSKHLTLASSTFKIMLNGQWGEASKLEITAEDWNTEAMLILMSVIHGQNQQVPKVISLEILTNIAILVDYYECREAIDLAAEIWINKLTQPKEPSRDLVFWLFISWVFRREEVFRAMTTVALRQSRGPLQALNLPIPERIIGEYRKASDQLTENSLAFSELIDRLRCEFIGDILASLKELGSDLLQGKAGLWKPRWRSDPPAGLLK